jgi:polyisoprenoid-binding protein YceI
MKTTILTFLALAVFASNSFAAPVKFNIGGRKTMQLAQVESVTDFETFTGRTDGVTGSITFDPAKKTGGGTIVVDVASISTGIDVRDDHMRSGQWLDAAKHPKITFETTGVRSLGGDRYSVTGKFTMRGVTKTITTTATVKHMKESDATKKAGFKGDVLQVKTNFKVKLSDYGIKISGPAEGKVANDVTISVVVYGQSGA